MGERLNAGCLASWVSVLSGALIGGLVQGTVSIIEDCDFWSGAKLELKINKENRILNFDSKQYGKKFGKHKSDYPEMNTYEDYYKLSNEIYNNPDAVIYRYPLDSPHYPGETHYIYNGNLLRLDSNGNFVSLYPIIKY